MKASLVAAIAFLASGFAGGEATAQDLAAGKQQARACTACHGALGIATSPDAPNLAGESKLYIERQLEAFRSGERKHQQMTLIAQQLSDEDIEVLAAWFNAIKVTVEEPDLDG